MSLFCPALGVLFKVQASSSNHSEPQAWAHPRTPVYLLCSQLCCTISSVCWHYKRSPHLRPRYWGRCSKYNTSQYDDSLVEWLQAWGDSFEQKLSWDTHISQTKILWIPRCGFKHREDKPSMAWPSPSPQHHWQLCLCFICKPYTQGHFRLLEEGVMMTYTRNFDT
jgi:hypothetical protein